MGAQALRHGPALPSRADAELDRPRGGVDVEALVDVGWDPAQRLFAPSPEHPVFGFSECVVNGCIGVGLSPTGMSDACRSRWRIHHPDLCWEEFVAVQRPRIDGRRKCEVLWRVCCVGGFDRPAYGSTGLCIQCKHSYAASRVASVDEWIAGANHGVARGRRRGRRRGRVRHWDGASGAVGAPPIRSRCRAWRACIGGSWRAARIGIRGSVSIRCARTPIHACWRWATRPSG